MGTGTGSIDLSTLNNLHDNLTQHFWFNSDSGATYGTGVHMTLSSQAEFIANPTGQNILMNTDGISIRSGLIPLMVLDNDSLDFNVVVDQTQGTYRNVASFGTISSVGRKDDYNITIAPTNFELNSGSNNGSATLFRVGASGNPTSEIYQKTEVLEAQTELEDAPISGTTITILLKYFITAELSSFYSETISFTAGTSATKSWRRGTIEYTAPKSFAITGLDSVYSMLTKNASYSAQADAIDLGILQFGSRQDGGVGNNSATIGNELVAPYSYQTVVGKHNVPTDAPFVVGAGSPMTNQNAFIVDWNGNSKVNGNVYANCASDSSGTAHIGQVFNWQGNLKSNLTANAGSYVEGNGSITLKGGHVYLVLAYVSMTNSTNGTVDRRAQIFNKTANAAVLTGDKFVASQVWGTVETQTIYEANEDVTLTVRGSASRPTTTIPTAWIRAVCIA